MNTGDLSGDVFFDVLYTTILPLYCSRVDARLCASRVNKHSSDDSLYRNDTVVTQLKIEVKDAAYGPYAQCSVNEETKDYECKCVKYSWFIIPVYFECTDPRVGRNEIEKSFGSKSIFGKLCNTFGDEGTTLRTGEWDRASNDFFAIGNGHYQKTFQDSKDQRIQGANTNLWCDWTETADRIGGTWYSTLLIGLNRGTWRAVKQIKRISRRCHSESFLTTVESYGNDSCFRRCDSIGGETKRNITDPCWMECFIDSILGERSKKTDVGRRDGGMTREEITDAWSRPFDSYDVKEGGCPDYESKSEVEVENGNETPSVTSL